MAAIPVSVVIVTLNEETNLPGCLEALGGRFAEVVVVDSQSTDRTVEIACEAGARVVSFRWNGRWPRKRAWTLANLPLANPWVFWVDADERVTPALIDEIAALFEDGPKRHGYFVALDYVFLDRVLRHGHRVWKLVLFNRHYGRFEDCGDASVSMFGDVEGHYQPQIDGPAGRLRARLIHHDHRTLFDYFARHNRYSDWEAFMAGNTALSGLETQLGWRRVIKPLFRRLGGIRPLVAFANSYLLRLGFLDGAAGFHYALAQGVYYWQVHLKAQERARRGAAQ